MWSSDTNLHTCVMSGQTEGWGAEALCQTVGSSWWEGQSGRASEGLPPQRPDRRSRSRRPPTAPPSGERATVSEGDYQAQRRSVSVSGASAHRLQALALTPRYKHELPRAAKYTCAGPPPRAAEVRAAPAFATPESAAERRWRRSRLEILSRPNRLLYKNRIMCFFVMCNAPFRGSCVCAGCAGRTLACPLLPLPAPTWPAELRTLPPSDPHHCGQHKKRYGFWQRGVEPARRGGPDPRRPPPSEFP